MQSVLIIDDDPSIRMMLAEYISGLGMRVITAADGRAGIAMFEQELPAFVLCDIFMPEVDGFQVLHHIKAIRPETVAMIMTGQGQADSALRVLRLGGTDYFTKPIKLQALGSAICHYAQLIQEDSREWRIAPYLEDIQLRLNLANSLEAISSAIVCLTHLARPVFGPVTIASIRMGLDEMLVNACIHGNLALTPDERCGAIEVNQLEELLVARAKQLPYTERRIHVDFQLNPEQLQCSIRDEGAGFDWRTQPTTLTEDMVFSETGRGIPLTRMQFDEVRYNEVGNEVTLIKRRVVSG